jgi:hypothetical protein
VMAFATRVVSIAEYRKSLASYLAEKMNLVAPSLTALLGERIGARLISHAGSLTNLSKYPASTVQILGAEKALFRALKTKGNTPKVCYPEAGTRDHINTLLVWFTLPLVIHWTGRTEAQGSYITIPCQQVLYRLEDRLLLGYAYSHEVSPWACHELLNNRQKILRPSSERPYASKSRSG